MLKSKNGHPRDERIFFDEEPHIYYIDGEALKQSVTGIIHSYFPHFDADKIAYFTNRKHFNNPDSKYYQMTIPDIKELWEMNRDEAAAAGTKLHKDIEDFFNGIKIINESKEYGFFTNFRNDYPDLVPYRTEWEIYDEDLKLAGSIDITFINEDGTITLGDWKRSKEIVYENRREYGSGPLKEYSNCNYIHYSLQLNVYKFILERKYGQKVKNMFLLVLHPNNENYIKIDVNDMQEKVKELFGQ